MPPMASSHKIDDFDMAKLQKSLKQRQRHSVNARPHIAKLTPAEIRSLTHGATVDKQKSQDLSRSTPSTDKTSAYQAQVSRASSVSLPPTLPHDSSQKRRASQSSAHHSSHHGETHHPRPRASHQADFMITNGLQHRRSSGSAASSVRSLPMYRGHEVTRTGSLTMLQRPAQDIVTNPLSMFSRPRQATINSAPDPRRDLLDMDPYEAQAMVAAEENVSDSIEQDRELPEVQRVDSPVSTDDVKLEDAKKQAPMDDEPQMPETDVIETRPMHDSTSPEAPNSNTNPQEVVRQSDATASSGEVRTPLNDLGQPPKKTPKKRFSFHAGFLEKNDKEPSMLTKKSRRRTVSFTKSIPDTDSTPTEAAESDGKQKSEESSGDDIPTHPAVHPLSPISAHSRSTSNTTSIASSIDSAHVNSLPRREKGKSALTPLIVPKSPVYGRCACCGKIKRPSGFSAELSPVLENEYIRTNFSIEMERAGTSHSNGSNESAKPRRYTPIIPMEIADESREGSIRTVQASIEPQLEEFKAKPRKKKNSEPSRFVRFASLHKRKAGPEEETDEEEIEVTSSPIVDPTIEPKNDLVVRPPRAAWDSVDSIDTMSTASIVTARPISMSTVKAPSHVQVKPRPSSSSVIEAPSKGSSQNSSLGRRGSVIDQWYEHAIKQGPKQDVITVVGWDNRGKKIESEPERNQPVLQPAKVDSVKETSPYETQLAHNEIAASPTKEKESKRWSLLSGGLFKKLITSSRSEEAKTSTDTTPTSVVQASPLFPKIVPNDSDLSMSGANGSIPAPTSQEAKNSATASSHRQTTTTPPPESEPPKFKQYSSVEDSKGHANKLSLGLNGEDMSLGLPTPHLGPHFARSNTTLRDLVLAQRTPELEKELEAAMVAEKGTVTAVTAEA